MTDICDAAALDEYWRTYQPDVVMHLFSAESHVDRSMNGPEAFMQTNIMGTYQLLEASGRFIATKIKIVRRLSFHHFHH